MSTIAIISLVLQYGPTLFEAIGRLIASIRSRNPQAGADAVMQLDALALAVARAIEKRKAAGDFAGDDDRLRNQAYLNLVNTAAARNLRLSESDARYALEGAHKRLEAEGG